MKEKTLNLHTFPTRWGRCLVAERGNRIVRMALPGEASRLLKEIQSKEFAYSWKPTPLLKRAEQQIREYLAGKRNSFHLPYQLEGTPFQQKVWKALVQIPYGRTRSYGDVAILVGSPHASRAVGGSCNRNPLPLLVPCHRVVGKGGALTGFGGGIALKQRLLDLENRA